MADPSRITVTLKRYLADSPERPGTWSLVFGFWRGPTLCQYEVANAGKFGKAGWKKILDEGAVFHNLREATIGSAQGATLTFVYADDLGARPKVFVVVPAELLREKVLAALGRAEVLGLAMVN